MPADEAMTPAQAAATLRRLPTLCEALGSGVGGQQLCAAREIRRLLSIDTDPPIQAAVDAGVVPLLLDCLRQPASPDELLFVTAWSLTNVCSGTPAQARCVVKCGGVPPLTALLRHKNQQVSDQAAWALGNLAADSAELRDVVLDAGVLSELVHTLGAEESSLPVLRTATWAVHNLVRHTPRPSLEQVTGIVPSLAAMCSHADAEVASEACWALALVSEGSRERAQVVVDSGCVGAVVKLLGAASMSLVKPALKCVGNFVQGSDCQTQAVLDAGVTEMLPRLLEHKDAVVRSKACLIVGHIAAGTTDQIQAVIGDGLLDGIVHVLDTDTSSVCQEAMWTLVNIAVGGTRAQLGALVKSGGIPLLFEAAELEGSQCTRIATAALDGLYSILQAERVHRKATIADDTVDKSWRDTEPWLDEVEDCGGAARVKHLCIHACTRVFRAADALLHDFLETDDDASCSDEEADGAGCGAGAMAASVPARPRSPVRATRSALQSDEQRMKACLGLDASGTSLASCGTAVTVRLG